ncbi:Fc.00g095470.m01.CDS01 [Cosmosporella sp. VM-42]
MPNNQNYLKIWAFFKKKEGMTTDEFHKYWDTVHANMCLSCKGFIITTRRYVQFHFLLDHNEMAKSMGVPALDWDGSSEIYVKSWEDWQPIYHGKDYPRDFRPYVQFQPLSSLRKPLTLFVCTQRIAQTSCLNRSLS